MLDTGHLPKPAVSCWRDEFRSRSLGQLEARFGSAISRPS